MSCNPIYPDEPIQLLGVVFSSELSDSTQAEMVARKLESVSLPFCVSIHKAQKEAYSRVFTEDRLVESIFPIKYPLGNLLSVHNTFPFHDLLLISSGLAEIEETLIRKLIDELREREGEHDFFVFENKGQLEPLFGIYTREGLQKLSDLYTLGQLEDFSMEYVLKLGNTYAIP